MNRTSSSVRACTDRKIPAYDGEQQSRQTGADRVRRHRRRGEGAASSGRTGRPKRGRPSVTSAMSIRLCVAPGCIQASGHARTMPPARPRARTQRSTQRPRPIRAQAVAGTQTPAAVPPAVVRRPVRPPRQLPPGRRHRPPRRWDREGPASPPAPIVVQLMPYDAPPRRGGRGGSPTACGGAADHRVDGGARR